MRYFELMKKNNGYPILIAGTLIGAMRNGSLFPECTERKHPVLDLFFDEPDIDIIYPDRSLFPMFDSEGFEKDFKQDPFQSLLNVSMIKAGYQNRYRTQWFMEIAGGYLYPRIRDDGGKGDIENEIESEVEFSSPLAFIEEWKYGKYGSGWAASEPQRARDGIAGKFCDKFFETSNLQVVDISFDVLAAKGYVFKGADYILQMAFGEWRKKIDKSAYDLGETKGRSWEHFHMTCWEGVWLCERIFPEMSYLEIFRLMSNCPTRFGNKFKEYMDAEVVNGMPILILLGIAVPGALPTILILCGLYVVNPKAFQRGKSLSKGV